MSNNRNRVAAQAGPRRSVTRAKADTSHASTNDAFRPKDDPASLKKLTFQIDVDLHRKLKAIAAQEGKTMREIVEEQLERYVTSKK